MIGSRRMMLSSGKLDYVDRVLATQPSHFWPFQGDLSDIAGNAPLTSNGSTITYPVASGPSMSAGDVSVYSIALGLYEPANNFNANQNTNGWSYGGWFKANSWALSVALMGCYSPTMLHISSNNLYVYPGGTGAAISLTNNTWHHFFFVADPITTRYHTYLDGVQLTETTTGKSMSLSAGTQLNVGQYNDSTSRTTLNAAYCGWWKNKALSPSTVEFLAGLDFEG